MRKVINALAGSCKDGYSVALAVEMNGPVQYVRRMMTRTEQSFISELLDAAKSAGADGAMPRLSR